MTTRYNNGKIYVIRNCLDNEIYVGSTCMPLHKRWYNHKQTCKNLKYNGKIYQHMRNLGVDNFYIELIEDYACENKNQLNRREGEIMRSLNATLNMRIAGRTKKQHYQENKAKILEQQKQYNEQNRAKIQEYYQANKDRIKEQRKQHYQANKAKRQEFYYANKDRINKQRRERRRRKKNTLNQRSD